MAFLKQKPVIKQQLPYFQRMMEPQQLDFTVLQQHQTEALEKIHANDFAQINPAIISLPTGTGKTAILATIPFVLKAKRVLVIAPDLEIAKQLRVDLMGAAGANGIAEMTLVKLGLLKIDQQFPSVEPVNTTKELDLQNILARDVVLANADKFHTQASSKWREVIPQDTFDLILVDEAHHLPSEKWKKIVEFFKPCKLVFLTATPYRAGGASIVGDLTPPLCNGKLIYHFSLREAIKRQCIKNPNFESLPSSADNPTHRVITAVAKKLAVMNAGRPQRSKYQGMIIALDKNDANDIMNTWKELNLQQYASAAVFHDGVKKGQRTITKNKFKKFRKIDVLIVVQMLKEGFDHPPISVVGIVRKIGSPLLFTQFIGRAFRIIRLNGKLDPNYDQSAFIITADEFKQQINWKKFTEETLIPEVEEINEDESMKVDNEITTTANHTTTTTTTANHTTTTTTTANHTTTTTTTTTTTNHATAKHTSSTNKTTHVAMEDNDDEDTDDSEEEDNDDMEDDTDD